MRLVKMGIRRVYLDIILVVIHVCIVCGNDPDATNSNIAYVGETVTIDCPLTGSYTYPAWYGPPGSNTRYTNTNNPNMYVTDRISYADNNRDLIRTGVTIADAGTYECSKTLSGILKVGVHTLHVRVRPDPPVITASPGWVVSGGIVSGTEGQRLTLTCVCRGGFPAPTLAWYRNSVTPAAGHVALTTPTNSSATSVTVTFTFTPGINNDKQTYICQSSFTDPHTEPINQTSVQLYLNLKPSPPILQQNRDGTAESIDAILQCDTSGFRPQDITISWKYKGTDYGGIQHISTDGDKYKATSTLELHVKREDNGGSVECIVAHSPTQSSLSESIAMNVRFAPYLVAVSGNRQTVADRTLTLTCTVGDANPAVSGRFTWTGPGVETRTSQAVTLTPTREQDGATVTCTATNAVGPTTSSAVNLDLTYHPITTIKEGTSITKTEGDRDVVLHCSTDSKPTSTITWYHETDLASQVININELNYAVGTNRTVNRSDYGTYKCTADNGITGAKADREKSVTLAVLFPPLTVGLTGYIPGMVANGANTLTLTCTADYSRPESTIAWRKGSSQISGSTSAVLSGSYGGQQKTETLTWKPTRLDDDALITCTAENNVTALPLVETVQLDLRYGPEPSITSWPNTVTEGDQNVYLTCSAISKPAATFTWYKGTTILGTGTGTLAHNSWSYKINKVNRADTGQYHCEASNEVSSVAVPSMTLTVRYPPDVTATGHDGTVNDMSVTITCSASGVHDTYTYHGWIQTWPGGHVISHQPELPATQTLTLTNLTYQHSGIYTCKASNDVPNSIRQGSTSVITIRSYPVIIDHNIDTTTVHTVFTKLHHPNNINITYYSNVDGTTVSFHRVVNNVILSASVGVVTTETAVIQLPVFDSTVQTSGTRATVKLTINHKSELGFYQVKVRNTIGTAPIDVQLKFEGPPEPPEHPAVSGVFTASVNVSWNLGCHGGFSQTFVVQYSTDGMTWINGTTLDTGLSESRDRQYVSIDSLGPGQLYHLRIYAYNEKGQSAYTNSITVITDASVTDAEKAASIDIGPIVGGVVAAVVVIIIIVAACVLVIYKKGYRIIKGSGNKSDKYSTRVYENDFGTDRRKPPDEAPRVHVPTTPATQDSGPSATTSAGTGPGPVYEEVDGGPQAGAESQVESVTATYEMLEPRQTENRTYDELRVPVPAEYENTRIP